MGLEKLALPRFVTPIPAPRTRHGPWTEIRAGRDGKDTERSQCTTQNGPGEPRGCAYMRNCRLRQFTVTCRSRHLIISHCGWKRRNPGYLRTSTVPVDLVCIADQTVQRTPVDSTRNWYQFTGSVFGFDERRWKKEKQVIREETRGICVLISWRFWEGRLKPPHAIWNTG